MAGKFLKAYLWPIAAIAAYVLVAIAWHGWGYARALWRFLDSPEWWAENTYAVILFTRPGRRGVVNIAARQRHEREPYEGWTVTVVDGDQ
ncbi:MAG: hypothetical protein KatS3mg118_3011 [Paracoccaceae bacterium]|nr:MAG: hypothetical protein KatS3mg118_3011 [Paracoccaceae bacterium]